MLKTFRQCKPRRTFYTFMKRVLARPPTRTVGDLVPPQPLDTGGAPGHEQPSPIQTELSSSAQAEFQRILDERHPMRVLHALLDPVIGDAFIKTAPPSAFVEVLHILDPRYFFDPLKDIHRWIEAWVRRISGIRDTDSYSNEFARNIDTILSKRMAAGHRLGLHEYNYLLHCARVLGRSPIARDAWASMKLDHVTPNLESYNCFMEASVWAGAYHRGERWKLQVNKYSFETRQQTRKPIRFRGHGTGKHGLSFSMLGVFQRMASNGVEGNELTFTNLLVAMGRNRDMEGVKQLLKSTWKIDLDLLQELDEEELETPTFYEEGSPLKPSVKLLQAIAHVYGINSDIETGLQLVDFVSRQYNLTVPKEVWSELLEWSYVLQTYRGEYHTRDFEPFGTLLPPDAVDSIWQMMLDEPYKIEPDLPMCSLETKAMRNAKDLDKTLEAMRRARTHFEQSVARQDRLRREAYRINTEVRQEYREAMARAPGHVPAFYILPAKWFDIRREVMLAELTETRDRHLLWRDARRLVENFRPPNDPLDPDWWYRDLPKLVKEWEAHLPNETHLFAPTGVIEFDTRWARWQISHTRMDNTKLGPFLDGLQMQARNARHYDDWRRREPRDWSKLPENHDELISAMLDVPDLGVPAFEAPELEYDDDEDEDDGRGDPLVEGSDDSGPDIINPLSWPRR